MLLKIIARKAKFLKFLSEIISFRSLALIATHYCKKIFLRKKIPEVAYLDLVFKCQFKCEYCGVASYPLDSREGSLEETKAIIGQLVRLGVPRVHFSGGEPLLREDLEELIFYSYRKAMVTVLETNGWGLSRERLLSLKRCHLSCICISLNGADEKTHDNISGVKGSFLKVIEAIKLCRRERLPCVISTIVRREILKNGGLSGILGLAEGLKVSGIRLISPRPMGRWLDREKEILSEEEKLEAKDIVNLSGVPVFGEGPNERSCGAADSSSIFISPSGEVQPCGYIPYSFGNIRFEGLAPILKRFLAHNMNSVFKKSRGCIIQDMAFREKYINQIKREASLPVKLY